MTSYSSTTSYISSPTTSPATQPVKMTTTSAPSFNTTITPKHQTHAFSSSTLRKLSNSSSDLPSAYVSDLDLFADILSLDDNYHDDDEDMDEPYLSEPPAPPRPAEVWLAQPLLPPVLTPRRRSSGGQTKAKSLRQSQPLMSKG